MLGRSVAGSCLVSGSATGRVLHSDVPLSFWGGVDPSNGMVIDEHHPLHGENLTGRIVVIPGGRGSCGGSATIFEMLLNGTAPAGLVFSQPETILTLGVVIAEEMFDQRIPVLRVDDVTRSELATAGVVTIHDGSITDGDGPQGSRSETADTERVGVMLSPLDRQFLDGDFGEAARIAMRIVLRAAALEGATRLLDVEMAHVDGVFYQGPASLKFATTLRDLGARVRVPSTSNPICIDRLRWRDLGVPASMGEPSEQLADAYLDMGVKPTYTCAPYLLRERPGFGQQIASGESNAVVYINSVIGARTMKYPNYLDLLLAITGRAPDAGSHREVNRLPTVRFDVPPLIHVDDSFYPILGYHIGKIAPNDIPVICGLESWPVSEDNLKNFGAAFATTSAAPMFHIVGATPEAAAYQHATVGLPPDRRHQIHAGDLLETWREISSGTESEIGLISVGTPHASLDEITTLAMLVQGKPRRTDVPFIITTGREVYAQARSLGHVAAIEQFGGRFINDTCWCLIEEPIVPASARSIVTNSGKYAHYGAAKHSRGMHLRSLQGCVEAAVTGRVDLEPPGWLRQQSVRRAVGAS